MDLTSMGPIKFMTGPQRNRLVEAYYEEHPPQSWEKLQELLQELSLYRFHHPFTDLEVKERLLVNFYYHQAHQLTPWEVVEIMYQVPTGLKRNELLYHFAKLRVETLSACDEKLLLAALYQYPMRNSRWHTALVRQKIKKLFSQNVVT